MGFWDFFRRADTNEPVRTQLCTADALDVDVLASKGWRALPSLTSDILGQEGERSSVAAEAAAQILAEMSLERLPQVDEAVRESFLLGYVGPAVVDKLRHHGQSRWAVLGLASFAPNGHTREAAIRELDTIENGNELPFLLLRSNDWVYEVRRAARRAILRRTQAGYAAHFVRALPMVERLAGYRRVDHADLVAQIERFLLEQGRDAVLEGMRHSGRGVRRACVSLLARIDDERIAEELRASIGDPDPIVAVRAIRPVCSRANDAQLRELLDRLDAYRHPRVRLAILEAAASRPELDSSRSFRDSLLDRSRAIRELARYQLRADAEVARGQVYAKALPLATGSRLLGALAGLGDVTHSDHASAVLPFVERTYPPRIRAEALTTYARLTKDLGAVLLDAIADNNPGLSKLALRLIVGRRVALSESEVSPLLASPLAHVRRNALGLLLHQGKWTGLRWALTALSKPEFSDEDRGLAHIYVETWPGRFNRSFARPRADELREIAAMMLLVAVQLTPSALRFIEVVMREQGGDFGR